MKKILFLLLFLPFLGNSQATFTAPVGYNTGAPTATPSASGTRWRFDLLTGKKYSWRPDLMSWDEDARGIDQVSGCSAPLYTPGYNQSTFAVNSCSPPELYQYTGAAWECLNCPIAYTAGTGIDITGDVITNTAPNVVQELSISGSDLSLSGGGGTVALPGGASDALGTGFAAGGGAGTIPGGTTISVQDGGDFILDLSAPMANGDISYIGDVGNNVGINISGNTFTMQAGNGGVFVSADDEKLVITGNGFVLPQLTTTQRNALSGLSVGQVIYNTDATANDASTGVMQVYNGTTWKNAW